jgi:hypothetical protein
MGDQDPETGQRGGSPVVSARTRSLIAAWAGLALAQAAGAVESVGVLAVADPPGPDEALAALAGALRPALAARAPGVLTAAELRERITGAGQAASLETLDAEYEAALALHAAGDFEGTIRALRALLARLERLPGGDAIHAQWTRVMLRLARSEQAVGRRSEAQTLLEELLRVEPDVVVDPRLYPPGFHRLVEDVRAEVKALWRRRLVVDSQPGARIFLERRAVGQAPVTLDLAPGRYHLSAGLGVVRAREVVVDLATEDRSIQIDVSVAEALRPDSGPGVALAGAQSTARLLTAAAWLGLDQLVAVRTGTEGGRPYLAAALHDVHRGTTEREGRVWLEDGALTPAAAQALAGQLLAGEESPLVEPGPVLEPSLRLGSAESKLPLSEPPPRAGSRAMGWAAFGTGLAAAVLAGITVAQANRAAQAYGDARAMLDDTGGLVKPPYTVAQHNAAIRRGDLARSTAIGTGVSAGVAMVAATVMGYASYRTTGEIGPIRF